MNPITYELLEARLLANKGTVIPAEPSLSYHSPCILIPLEPVIVCLEGIEYELGKNQCMFLRPVETEISIWPAGSKQFAPVYSIVFQRYRLDEQAEDCLIYRISHEQLPEHGRMMGLPRHALQQAQALVAGYSFTMTETPRLNFMLSELLHVLLDGKKYGTGFHVQDPAVQQTLVYMNLNFSRPLTRPDMAQLSGFNPSYFSSLFRKETGWSFSEYLTRIRIDEAKRLLLATEDSLQEIAGKTGFADGAYLSKSFKKTVHISTSEFRMRQGSERVAGMQFLGALLALGIQPVATTRELLQTSVQLAGDLDGIAEMEEIYSVEALRPLAPQLILAPTYYYNYPQSLKLLEEIAPVIMLEWGALDKLEEVRLIGRLLGRTAEAEEWIGRLEQKAVSARHSLSSFIAAGETVGLYERRHDNTWLIPHYTARSVFTLYRLLELAPPARIRQEVLDPGVHLCIEEQLLPGYAADHMFLIVPSSDTGAYLAQLMAESLWQKLVHERGCRLYLLPLPEIWMDDGVSLERQLDKLVSLLTGEESSQQFSQADSQPLYMDTGLSTPI